MHSSRQSGDPVLVGDQIEELPLCGIAFAPGSPPTSASDRILFDGDRKRNDVPVACLPSSLPSPQLCAPMPPDDLPVAAQTKAKTLAATLPQSFRDFLQLSGRPWEKEKLGEEVLSAVRAAGHKIWLCGGATRDLVASTPVTDVNDLDLCGTAPPGRFVEIVTRVLLDLGLEWEVGTSPGSLVCWVLLPGQGGRALEYRSLSLRDFVLPGTSSSMMMDAWARDFRFNAVYYDFLDETLIDPFGFGLLDIQAPAPGIAVRRFVPAAPAPESWLKGGQIVLRAIKFVHRWMHTYSIDADEFTKWVNDKSHIFSQQSPTQDDIVQLRGYAAGTLKKVPRDQWLVIAEVLGVRSVVEQMKLEV